jgi:hypothetical protein
LENNMAFNTKQDLVEAIKKTLVKDINEVPEDLKELLDSQAGKLADVMIEYVQAELQQLLSFIVKDNSFSVANSNPSNGVTGLSVKPVGVKQYKPLFAPPKKDGWVELVNAIKNK